MKTKRILVTGGGTAGHIYTTLEVARVLKKRQKVDILYVGGQNNIERDLIPKTIPFHSISVGKLRRELTPLHIRDSLRVAQGIVQAYKLIRSYKPHVVFAKGGYVTLPVIAVASQMNVPIVTHESDAILGLSNRLAAKVAQKLCLGFPLKYYPEKYRHKGEFTGIPVRNNFFVRVTAQDRQLFKLSRNFPILLITGGSQGAQAINEAFEPILELLLRKTQIIHLTGLAHEKRFNDFHDLLPKEMRDRYHPFGFIKKGMESAVKSADLVISRAGSSLAEFAASGKPMILIPLPTAANNHQVKNAEIYTGEGAAVTIRQHNLTPDRLFKTITILLNDKYRLKAMSEASKKMAKPDAADRVVRIIEEVLKN